MSAGVLRRLCALDDPRALGALLAMLAQVEGYQRREVLWPIRELGDPAAIPPLEEELPELEEAIAALRTAAPAAERAGLRSYDPPPPPELATAR